MKRDNIYIFDKLTFIGSLLGEIQTDFNMSFVIDGTKDSCKVIVTNYSDVEIEPYSIIYHPKTMTWWVVSHDKIERYANEFDINDDPTFLYSHNLELFGAIELLNARDLTDCGFNDNTYTIGEFILRLFSLSSFEYNYSSPIFLNAIDSNFLNKKVNFIKTFENYTLLSALREFLDAYNMVAKLDFSASYNAVTDKYTILYPMLNIVPKTGDFTNIYSEDYFDDVRQTKTMDKDSFGTCVVSNAENVISSVSKTFPSVGTVKASGTEYKIKPENAVIRLPSNVYKANWLKIMSTKAEIRYSVGNLSSVSVKYIDVSSYESLEKGMNEIVIDIRNNSSLLAYNEFIAQYNANKEYIFETIKKAFTVTLYNGNSLNPQTGKIIKGKDVPYIPIFNFVSKLINGVGIDKKELIFCDEETRNTLPTTYQGIYWKRGSNIIKGFDCFTAAQGSRQTLRLDNFKYTDLQQDSSGITFIGFTSGSQDILLQIIASQTFHFGPSATGEGDVRWIVNYIPMSDVKVKVDNQRDKKDIQLYNQNGKLTDSVALSKLINSYSKEISSDTITKFMQCYSYNDVPKVGSVVLIDNQYYVINNVSLDFSQNEKTENDFGYFIEYEVTMSKYVSTKSLLVNPNTNIRDYGIPQNFNVKRKQLYRDYYELNYTLNSDNESIYYLDPSNIFAFNHDPNELPTYVCVMKLTYEELVGGNDDDVQASDTWYYQLETTNYYLEKMIYVMLDFNDNNIIGYANQNVFSGFDISRVFTGLTDNLNTPISYVDSNGKVLGIDILYCTNEQITTTYQEYTDEESGGSFEGSIYNYSVFIPEEIYTKSLNRHNIRITENNYKKDALEVPVFEYACQIDDSDDVLIGDSILTQHNNCVYFYSHVMGHNLNQNNVLPTQTVQPNQEFTILEIYDGAELEYDTINGNKVIKVSLYTRQIRRNSDGEFVNQLQKDFNDGYDYAIFRHSFNLDTNEQVAELMFIFKNVSQDNIDNYKLILYLNHYKLN